MAFLTYDINPTLQLLAQGKPSPVAAAGGAVQQFAQAKQQKQEFDLRQQLGEIQKDSAKLTKLNQRSQAEAELANDMLNMYENPTQFQAQYPEYRQKMIQKDPTYEGLLPEEPPSQEQLQAMQKRSKTFQYWSEQELRKQQLDLMKQKAAQGQAEGKPDVQKKPTVEDVNTVLKKRNLEGGTTEGSSYYDELSEADREKLNLAVRSRTDQIMAQNRNISKDQAMEIAIREIEKSNAIKQRGSVAGFFGEDYAFDEETYRKSLGLDSTVPDTPTGDTLGSGTGATGSSTVSDAELGL